MNSDHLPYYESAVVTASSTPVLNDTLVPSTPVSPGQRLKITLAALSIHHTVLMKMGAIRLPVDIGGIMPVILVIVVG